MSHSMQDKTKISNMGTEIVIGWLASCRETLQIENVEHVVSFQEEDIDLLWTYSTVDGVVTKSVEIKTDTYYNTGNYFFETISNDQKNTIGCFMYCKADYLFYYFLHNELHIMNLIEVRKWFINNKHRFKTRSPSTRIQGFIAYNSVGYLVPRDVLLAEIPQHVKIVNLVN